MSDSFPHGINPTLDGASLIAINLDNTQTTSIMMQQRGIKHKWNLDRNGNTGAHKHLQCSSSAQLNVDAIRKKNWGNYSKLPRRPDERKWKKLPIITWRYKVILLSCQHWNLKMYFISRTETSLNKAKQTHTHTHTHFRWNNSTTRMPDSRSSEQPSSTQLLCSITDWQEGKHRRECTWTTSPGVHGYAVTNVLSGEKQRWRNERVLKI